MNKQNMEKSSDDLRKIVSEGQKNGKSAYQALKDAGYIKNISEYDHKSKKKQ